MSYHISILGDSISTYQGFNPYGYAVYYKNDRLYNNEIASVDDTWWKQVIDTWHGELCVNNSLLLMGYLKDGRNLSYDRFMREDTRYNGAIRLAAKEEDCLLADLALSGECYETLDYCHPTKKGHSTMAKLWLECLESMIKRN